MEGGAGGEEGNTFPVAALEAPMDTEDGADVVSDGMDDDRRPLSRVLPGGSPAPVSALPQIDEIEVGAEVEDTVRAQPIKDNHLSPVTVRCLHAAQADASKKEEGPRVLPWSQLSLQFPLLARWVFHF
jgi:hypothetical protein